MIRRCALVLVALLVAACSDAPATTTTTTSAPTVTTSTTATTTTTVPATTTSTTVPPWPLSLEATLDEGIVITAEVADEEQPALAPGETWDTSYSYSPNVVVDDDGVFHMFYTGWGVRTGIGHATSPDGRSFERSSDEPIIAVERNEGGRTAFAQAPVAYQADDGSWVMYFADLIGRRFNGRNIWRATAAEAAGPWTVDPDPIYTSEGAWDREVVTQGLVWTDDGLVLFYDGIAADIAIGALHSPDGISFTAFDDPATPEPSDPVLRPSAEQSWEGQAVGSPIPFATESGIELFYMGFEGPENLSGDRPLRLGYARGDLVEPWQRMVDNPVIVLETQNAAAGSLGYPWMSGLRTEDGYLLYYALGAGSRGVGVMEVTVDG